MDNDLSLRVESFNLSEIENIEQTNLNSFLVFNGNRLLVVLFLNFFITSLLPKRHLRK